MTFAFRSRLNPTKHLINAHRRNASFAYSHAHLRARPIEREGHAHLGSDLLSRLDIASKLDVGFVGFSLCRRDILHARRLRIIDKSCLVSHTP